MRKTLLQLFFILGVSFIISCEKEEELFPPVSNAEKNILLLPDGGNLVVQALEISNTVKTFDILKIHRNTINAGELNKVQVVKIAKSNSILSDFSGATVRELTRDYWQSHPDNPFDGQFWTVTFQPGENTKFLKLNIKPTDIVSLGRIGFGFQIAEAPDAQISATLNQVAVEISAKNQWDGIYKVYGNFFHPANTDLTGDFGTPTSGGELECALVTSGATSVIRDYGAPVGESVLVWNHTANVFTYFSGVMPRFSINASNSVNLSPAPGTIAFDPAPFNCNYNPSSKTFTLNYAWTSTGGQRIITEYLVYVRPR
jgi:hypothetical protein